MKKSRILGVSIITTILLGGLLFFIPQTHVFADDVGTVNIASESSGSKIAPGEFLPVSVKLVNFGSEKRIDVLVEYKIFDNAQKDIYLQKEVHSETETVAVDTTASFIKRIQIPYDFPSGLYTLVTEIYYPYQEQPAVSKFPFAVEKKIGGFFITDLMIYGGALLAIIVVFIVVAFLIRPRAERHHHIVSRDYGDKPKELVVYYEILDNIVRQMRLHLGDNAMLIAQEIPGLTINQKTGAVDNIEGDPAKIVSLLIYRYEKVVGQPLSFSIKDE